MQHAEERHPWRLLGGLALPVVLIGSILLADRLEGPKTAYVGVLAVTPMLSAVFGTPVTAGVVGLVALTSGWLFGLQADDGQAQAQTVRLVIIAIITVLAMLAAGARVRRERRLAEADRIVAAVAAAIIRPLPPQIRGVGLAARYTGAHRDAHVGGDFYDVVDTPHGLRVVLGDVRGKGLDAVRLANHVLGAFREAARRDADLMDVVGALDRLVRSEGGPEDFVTAVVLQVHGTTVTGVSCGHLPPLALPADGAVRVLDVPRDRPLGLGAGSVPAGVVVEAPVRVLLHSDGLTEARDRSGAFLDAGSVLAARAILEDDDALVAAVEQDVRRHSGGTLRDDVALLCLRVPLTGLVGAPPSTAAEPILP